MPLPYPGPGNKGNKNLAFCRLQFCLFLDLFFNLEEGSDISAKRFLNYNGQRDFKSQKIEFFSTQLWEPQNPYIFFVLISISFSFFLPLCCIFHSLSLFLPISAYLAYAVPSVSLLRLLVFSLPTLNSQKFSCLWSGFHFQLNGSSSLYFLPWFPGSPYQRRESTLSQEWRAESVHSIDVQPRW
jgi:hypothetical protein